jgi:hypothetical protein
MPKVAVLPDLFAAPNCLFAAIDFMSSIVEVVCDGFKYRIIIDT